MSEAIEPVSVRVNVFAFRKAVGLPVQVGVTSEALDLSELQTDCNTPIEIEWKIVTKGYRFSTNPPAIFFTSPGSEGVFGPVELCDKLERAKVRILEITGLAYAYTVSIQEESTGFISVLDPVIVQPTR